MVIIIIIMHQHLFLCTFFFTTQYNNSLTIIVHILNYKWQQVTSALMEVEDKIYIYKQNNKQ